VGVRVGPLGEAVVQVGEDLVVAADGAAVLDDERRDLPLPGCGLERMPLVRLGGNLVEMDVGAETRSGAGAHGGSGGTTRLGRAPCGLVYPTRAKLG